MQYFSEEYLEHHGIRGQKWGVRRYQNPDGSLTAAGKKRRSEVTNYGETGGVIPKGSTIYRVAWRSKKDKTYANRKYVSTSEYDNAKWQDEFRAYGFSAPGSPLYQMRYKTVKDIKVAPETEVGKQLIQATMKDEKFAKGETLKALNMLYSGTMRSTNGDPGDAVERILKRYSGHNVNDAYSWYATLNLAAETELGKQIMEGLTKSGYDAVVDTHGKDVSSDPIIIFNPDDKIGKKRVTGKYITKPTGD